jgi:hypothetical protein
MRQKKGREHSLLCPRQLEEKRERERERKRKEDKKWIRLGNKRLNNIFFFPNVLLAALYLSFSRSSNSPLFHGSIQKDRRSKGCQVHFNMNVDPSFSRLVILWTAGKAITVNATTHGTV